MATKVTREHDGESKAPKRVAAAEMYKMTQEIWIRAVKMYNKLVQTNKKAMIGLGDC